MNRAIIVGRLTRDPEMRTMPNGQAVTNFSVAVNRPFTNAQGQRDADYLNCVVFRKQAENVSKYCNKGSLVGVEGRIQTRSYDGQDGIKRYVTEIICDSVNFLGSRSNGLNDNYNDYNNYTNASTNNYSGASNMVNSNDIVTTDLNDDPYANMGAEVALSDDDLPF